MTKYRIVGKLTRDGAAATMAEVVKFGETIDQHLDDTATFPVLSVGYDPKTLEFIVLFDPDVMDAA